MSRLAGVLLLFLIAYNPFDVAARIAFFRAAGSTIIVADSSLAAGETMKQDEYTGALTPFDLSIRLNRPGPLSVNDYLVSAAGDVRDWTQEEKEQLYASFRSIDTFLQGEGVKLSLPDTIIMIKTTGRTEFGAEGWTRRNLIMLNLENGPASAHLVAHELFHVWSRFNPAGRDAVYALFGFKPCARIAYKEAMNNRVITNPDCPFLMHYITVNAGGRLQDVALMLYAQSEFAPGKTMDDYAAVGLLALTGKGRMKQPMLVDGAPVIYGLQEVPDLFRQIGTNTQYVLHAEEISAEHFAALVTGSVLEQPEYLTGLLRVLKGK